MNKILLGLMSAAFITACSAPAVKDTLLIQQSAQEQAKNIGLSVQEVLDETRDLQILAQREDLYFYSPTYIAQAEEEIRNAESAFKDKLTEQKVITHALTGQQLLKRGLENKKTVLNQLKLSLDGLALLEKLNAPTLLPGDYSDVQDDIKDLVILIEQGRTTQAIKDQTSVLNDIIEVEIDALKKTYLSQAEKALEKAIDADAEDFAPVSIEKANMAVEKLSLFIKQNRKQLQNIDDETQKAIHLAQHAEHVSVTVEPLLKLKIKDAEQHVLFIEKLIARIGQALNQQDVTHLPLDNQSIALAQAAETISKQATAMKQQEQWETEKAELEAKLATLQITLNNSLKSAQAPIVKDEVQSEEKAPAKPAVTALPIKETTATKPAATLPIEDKPTTDNTATLEASTPPAETVITPLQNEAKPATQETPIKVETEIKDTTQPAETVNAEPAEVTVSTVTEPSEATLTTPEAIRQVPAENKDI